MTDAEMLEELERLNAERTQGEWTRPYVLCLDDEYTVGVELGDEENSSYLSICDVNEEPDNYAANAAFIAAVANALPRLLALAEAGLRAEEMREALETAESWIERWAAHVGNCRGGDVCTCGRTAVLAEVRKALEPSYE